jgi:hypothetical protein
MREFFHTADWLSYGHSRGSHRDRTCGYPNTIVADSELGTYSTGHLAEETCHCLALRASVGDVRCAAEGGMVECCLRTVQSRI